MKNSRNKMGSITLDSTGYLCSVCLYKNVENASEIRAKLMKGEVDATIINAKLIPSVMQIFVAADKAALSDKLGKRRTRTIHTELLFNLSPSKSVTDSLKNFGIDDACREMLVVLFQDESGDKSKLVGSLIHGKLVDISELDEIINWGRIASLHGLNENSICHDDLKDLVISKSAIKDLLL